MKITKILFYDIVCPHCGAKIRLGADEYEKYKKATEDYGGSTILCQLDENEKGKCRDITYVNFDCPACKGYIPITVDGAESDRFGFKVSKCATPIYGIEEEVSIDKYIEDWLGVEDEEGEEDEADYINCEI